MGQRRRVNITLSPEGFGRATHVAKKLGRSLSATIEDSLAMFERQLNANNMSSWLHAFQAKFLGGSFAEPNDAAIKRLKESMLNKYVDISK